MSSPLSHLRSLARVCETFVVLDEVGSTNDWLRVHASGYRGCVIVLTDNQTEGRGRLSRSWISRPGESLALSIRLPWGLGDRGRRLSWLPLVAGATLVRALKVRGLEGVGLKWPNDVLVNDAKLAGILCEFHEPDSVIIGVGLNLAFALDDPPSPNATALAHHGISVSADLDDLLVAFVGELKGWSTMGDEDALAYAKTLVTPAMGSLGRLVSVQEMNGERWTGLAQELDDSGHLLVTPDDSSGLRVVIASDIEHLYQ